MGLLRKNKSIEIEIPKGYELQSHNTDTGYNAGIITFTIVFRKKQSR